MGAFDLIRKGVQGVKSAPFFSKVDEVLDSLPRNKGTGDEFLREIEKTKGVKPAEIQDRGIAKALKGKPKMTKAEVQKIFESNPPPRVQEKVLSGETPDYEEFLETKAQEEFGVDWFDLSKQEKAEIEQMYKKLPTTQYDQYKTPGGENYREILLKLPSRGLTNHERWELDLYNRDLKSVGQFLPEKQARYEELKAKEGDPNYVSGHYKEDPNLLAHIRVQDFKTPEGKKVLLVDEIQSDWHQAGRKRGYREGFDRDAMKDEMKQMIRERGALVNEFTEYQSKYGDITPEMQAKWNEFKVREEALEQKKKEIAAQVPDAPFKKNWHELAMKRVLDYAAENGYDSIAITPGAEQAKRYDLSKQIGAIEYSKSGDDNYKIKVYDPVGQPMNLNIPNTLDASGLEQYIGKEMAEKVASQATGEPQSLAGLDLQVGGEGMKGFYDKMLPDYLNNFGKQYGAAVREAPLNYTPSAQRVAQGAQDDALLGQLGVDVPAVAPTQYHMFDITPQLRDEVKNKGLPMYGKVTMPALEGLAAGTGAATIGSEVFDTNNEQQVQNPVHFTENPDAMLLELMQRN
jgi:hypothetical protein